MNNLTPFAQCAIAMAQKEAERFGHNYCGTEHLLLALIRIQEGVAARVLALNCDLICMQKQIASKLPAGDGKTLANVPYTPRSKKVLALASRESKEMDHSHVGTEHILLGLIREGTGVAAIVLSEFGLTLEKVRQAILTELQITKTEQPVSTDPVQRPAHYVSHPSGVECIQITEHMGFCLGNAIKYIWRADLKQDAIQDLEKAMWYIQREIARRKGAE